MIHGTHPTALPFESKTFDAVLSGRALEHVDEYSGQPGNEVMSLKEIHCCSLGGGFRSTSCRRRTRGRRRSCGG